MWRRWQTTWRLLVLIVAIFSYGSGPVIVRALAPTDVVIDPAGTNFGYLFEPPATMPAGQYRLKIRIKRLSDVNYSGETLDQNNWLSQTDSWSAFPLTSITPGQVIPLTGRVDAQYSTDPSDLQIAYRVDGSSTTLLAVDIPIIWLNQNNTSRLVIDNPFSPPATVFMNVQEYPGGATMTVPFDASPNIIVAHPFSTFSYQIYNSSGAQVLTGGPFVASVGQIIRPATSRAPVPRLTPIITGSETLDRNSSTQGEFRLTGIDNYFGPVEWRNDGVIINNQDGDDRVLHFPGSRLGQTRISATLTQSIIRETAEMNLTIVDYSTVQFVRILPNPLGDDWSGESITIKNTGTQSTNLIHWSIYKNGVAILTLNGPLAAGEQRDIPLARQLPNDGASLTLVKQNVGTMDFASYKNAPENVWLIRNNFAWQWDMAQPATTPTATTTSTDPAHPAYVGLVTVTLPSGRTIDGIDQATGQPIHVVVHSSYSASRPGLHKGDTISISGNWYKSQKGPYVSVRNGDIFLLIQLAHETVTKKQQVTTAAQTIKNAFATQSAQAADIMNGDHNLSLSSETSTISAITQSEPATKSPLSLAFWQWLIIGIIAVGVAILADWTFLRYNKARHD